MQACKALWNGVSFNSYFGGIPRDIVMANSFQTFQTFHNIISIFMSSVDYGSFAASSLRRFVAPPLYL